MMQAQWAARFVGIVPPSSSWRSAVLVRWHGDTERAAVSATTAARQISKDRGGAAKAPAGAIRQG
jgi:hypothetical protein